jgi:HK97 gp10 family phage protein
MTVTVKLEGFEGLERNLAQLEKLATRRSVARRALKQAAQPMADLAQSLAPVARGNLAQSVIVGAKLDGRQQGLHRRMFASDRTNVELFVGPSYLLGGGGRHGHLQEFGTVHHAPQPFMRPAWDQDHKALLQRLGQLMAAEIDKAVTRAARRAARGS